MVLSPLASEQRGSLSVVSGTLNTPSTASSTFANTLTGSELGWDTRNTWTGAVCQTFGKCWINNNMRTIDVNGSFRSQSMIWTIKD